MTREEMEREIGKSILDAYERFVSDENSVRGEHVVFPIAINRALLAKEAEVIYPRFDVHWLLSVSCPVIRVQYSPTEGRFLKPSEFFKSYQEVFGEQDRIALFGLEMRRTK